MSDVIPKMEPRQLGFFSEWFVLITWPDGRKQRVDGFSTEAHARGWMEHESAAWLASPKEPFR